MKFSSERKLIKNFNFKNISIILLISMFLVSGFITPSSSATKTYAFDHEVRVLLFTNAQTTELNVGNTSSAYTSLTIDGRVTVDVYMQNEYQFDNKTFGTYGGADPNTFDMSIYQVVVIENYLPENTTVLKSLLERIEENNIGILFFGGFYEGDQFANDDDVVLVKDEYVDLTLIEEFLPAYFINNNDTIDYIMGDVFYNSTGLGFTPDMMLQNYSMSASSGSNFVDDNVQIAVSDEEEERLDAMQKAFDNGEDFADEDKPLNFTTNIAWQSCPLIRDRYTTYAAKPGAKTMVEVPSTNEPLLVVADLKDIKTTNSTGKVMFISPGVGYLFEVVDDDGNVESSLMNEPFSLWPYFNYLMYMSMRYLDITFEDFADTIETFADWPHSPIPHSREATIWMIFIGLLWVFNFSLFFYLKGKKRAPEYLGDGDKKLLTEMKSIMADSPSLTRTELSDKLNINPERLQVKLYRWAEVLPMGLTEQEYIVINDSSNLKLSFERRIERLSENEKKVEKKAEEIQFVTKLNEVTATIKERLKMEEFTEKMGISANNPEQLAAFNKKVNKYSKRMQFNLEKVVDSVQVENSSEFSKEVDIQIEEFIPKQKRKIMILSARKDLLKFKELAEKSNKIEMAEVAKELEIDEAIMKMKLLRWSDVFSIETLDKTLIVPDVSTFSKELDTFMVNWDEYDRQQAIEAAQKKKFGKSKALVNANRIGNNEEIELPEDDSSPESDVSPEPAEV